MIFGNDDDGDNDRGADECGNDCDGYGGNDDNCYSIWMIVVMIMELMMIMVVMFGNNISGDDNGSSANDYGNDCVGYGGGDDDNIYGMWLIVVVFGNDGDWWL